MQCANIARHTSRPTRHTKYIAPQKLQVGANMYSITFFIIEGIVYRLVEFDHVLSMYVLQPQRTRSNMDDVPPGDPGFIDTDEPTRRVPAASPYLQLVFVQLVSSVPEDGPHPTTPSRDTHIPAVPPTVPRQRRAVRRPTNASQDVRRSLVNAFENV